MIEHEMSFVEYTCFLWRQCDTPWGRRATGERREWRNGFSRMPSHVAAAAVVDGDSGSTTLRTTSGVSSPRAHGCAAVPRRGR